MIAQALSDGVRASAQLLRGPFVKEGITSTTSSSMRQDSLYLYAHRGDTECLDKLLKEGGVDPVLAYPNNNNNYYYHHEGLSALEVAAQEGHRPATELLFNYYRNQVPT